MALSTHWGGSLTGSLVPYENSSEDDGERASDHSFARYKDAALGSLTVSEAGLSSYSDDATSKSHMRVVSAMRVSVKALAALTWLHVPDQYLVPCSTSKLFCTAGAKC